jgi:hypothetical protein
MIERGQINHIELVRLGKTLLLLFKRQELLVHLPAMNPTDEERSACISSDYSHSSNVSLTRHLA